MTMEFFRKLGREFLYGETPEHADEGISVFPEELLKTFPPASVDEIHAGTSTDTVATPLSVLQPLYDRFDATKDEFGMGFLTPTAKQNAQYAIARPFLLSHTPTYYWTEDKANWFPYDLPFANVDEKTVFAVDESDVFYTFDSDGNRWTSIDGKTWTQHSNTHMDATSVECRLGSRVLNPEELRNALTHLSHGGLFTAKQSQRAGNTRRGKTADDSCPHPAKGRKSQRCAKDNLQTTQTLRSKDRAIQVMSLGTLEFMGFEVSSGL